MTKFEDLEPGQMFKFWRVGLNLTALKTKEISGYNCLAENGLGYKVEDGEEVEQL